MLSSLTRGIRLPSAQPTGSLSDLEGHILASVARRPNSTAYEVMRELSSSALAALSASPGAIYPATKRLRERGLLVSTRAATGDRQHELLLVTEQGQVALQRWISDVPLIDLLPYDPLRAKLLYFDLLSEEQKKEWLKVVKRALETAEKLLNATESQADDVYHRLAVSQARQSVRQRRTLADQVKRTARGSEE
jgi:DNA-binding PadR family transcriptional regulator